MDLQCRTLPFSCAAAVAVVAVHWCEALWCGALFCTFHSLAHFSAVVAISGELSLLRRERLTVTDYWRLKNAFSWKGIPPLPFSQLMRSERF